jgi:20S proteasome alpha/beta subunit
LYHLTGELTKQGYDAFQRLLSDYAKDRKIGLGASGFSHVVGDIRVKVEYADDFAASLVRQFNEPGNVEVETFDDIVTNAAHCGTRKRTPYIEFKKEMV